MWRASTITVSLGRTIVRLAQLDSTLVYNQTSVHSHKPYKTAAA